MAGAKKTKVADQLIQTNNQNQQQKQNQTFQTQK